MLTLFDYDTTVGSSDQILFLLNWSIFHLFSQGIQTMWLLMSHSMY